MMLKKFVEGHNVTYVVPLDKSIEDYPLFMDATRSIEDAIRRDVKNKYEPEYGPHYGIECLRVTDYVEYVFDKINRENLYRFDTKSYRFFLGSVPIRKSGQIEASAEEQQN
jgi:hypothetical protein